MTEHNDNILTGIAIMVTSIILASLTFVLGTLHGIEKIQHEAVKNGHAVWTADASGKATFQWK